MHIIMFARLLPPHYSGAGTQALLLASQLRKRGHRVEFLTVPWQGDNRPYRVDGFEVTVLETPLHARHGELGFWWALFKYLFERRDEFDILHSHGADYIQSIIGPLARLLGKRSLVKVTLAESDLRSLTNSRIATLHRLFLRNVDAYVAISRDIRREFGRRDVMQERVFTIPNGVDTDRFCPAVASDKLALQLSLGIPVDRPIGLFVGVFDKRKRISWLIEEWIRNNAFGSGARLLAVGPTSREPYGSELKEYLKQLASQHPDLVEVRDFSANIEDYYKIASFFILPSSNEGLPNVVLEAMASALPCVVTRVSGSRDLVHDGETGATFDVADSEGLAAATRRVLGDEGLRMGTAGRYFILIKGYDIAHVAERYEGLYRQLTNSYRSPRGSRSLPL